MSWIGDSRPIEFDCRPDAIWEASDSSMICWEACAGVEGSVITSLIALVISNI